MKLRTQPTNGYTLLTYNDHVCAGRSVTSHLPPLQPAGFAAAMEEISRWPDYRPTPLRSLAGLARHLGIGALYYKDESERFGLGSFKALGGAYAVRQLLSQRIGERRGIANVATEDLLTGRYADDVEDITVCTATDGNHGRSVAWGARMFGCRSVVYIHENVSKERERAIASFGARVVRTPGNYDDAVRRAAADSDRHGWLLVSDTSYEGYVDTPREVMYGYGVIAIEAQSQWPAHAAPTHVFLQAGVGAFAAAVTAALRYLLPPPGPRIVVVEPDCANCVLASVRAGTPTRTTGALDTIMAGLACGEVSLLAWDVLQAEAFAFMSVSDKSAEDAMRVLADAPYGDEPIVAGESAVAGLSGLMLGARDTIAAGALKLDAGSRVLLVGTEGATDPQMYARIVGRTAADVGDFRKRA